MKRFHIASQLMPIPAPLYLSEDGDYMLVSDHEQEHAADKEQIAKLQRERDDAMKAERERCKRWIEDIMERMEYAPCWYDDNGDCGNWPECNPHCPLKEMRDFVGIVPQDDGGLDKQPSVEAKSKENPSE